MKARLDQHLADQGLSPSRSRARDAILRGCVSVNGAVVRKAGQLVGADDRVALDDPAMRHVSRAAVKLEAGLDAGGLAVAGRLCLDLGASTGGFVSVLLERGARHVIAVDVGHGQLDAALAADPRVTNVERLNARDLQASHLDGRAPEILTCDLSFISLRLALPPALALCAPGACAVLLVKPQFEVGRAAIGKGGLVRTAGDAEAAATGLRDWLDATPGWRAGTLLPSPIRGGDGNGEFLLTGVKDQA